MSDVLLESSCSDSGISDEGSEHELGERQHRLTAIRRLVRQLEVTMSPNCEARIRMQGRISAVEEELKNLQNQYHTLVTQSPLTDISHFR